MAYANLNIGTVKRFPTPLRVQKFVNFGFIKRFHCDIVVLFTNDCERTVSKMSEQKKQTGLWPAVLVSAIILISVGILAMLRQQPPSQMQVKPPHDHNHNQPLPFEPHVDSPDESAKTDEPTKTDAEPAIGPKTTINDVIRTARSWTAIYESWYGKTAPDFTLTDITGKQHKLSDYHGKDVMIIFWATWCIPCHMEIPHLIALRNIVSTDKLAMLAISDKHTALVKRFAADRKVNYTVISANTLAMPSPYNSIRAIPSSFFIDSEGKIKIATEGVLSLDAIKAILQAE